LPLVHWDPQRVRRILEILFERAARTPRAANGATVRVSVTLRVPFIEIRVPHERLPGQSDGPPGEVAVSLARNLALLHAGSLECEPLGGDGGELWRLRLPLPNLAGSTLPTGGRECDSVLVLSSHGRVPEEFDGYQTPSGGGVRLVAPDLLVNDLLKNDGAPALVWDLERGDLSEWIVVRSLRLRETHRSLPLLILTAGREIPKSSDLGEFLRLASAALGSGPIVLVDPSEARRGGLAAQLREGCGIVELVEIGRVDEIPALLQDVDIGLFILNTLEDRDLRFIRDIPRLAAVPILVFVDRLQGLEEIEFCVQTPKVVLCNRHILHPEELRDLIDRLRRGDGSHGPPTSGLVKKAILYLNLHYASVPSRYRLADFVHVNEDYLTRIFRRELGLTPWEYLNRYRIRVAEALLRTTSESIRRIASGAGFRDQAYFCRVFRAITGRSPSEFRERSGSTVE
jgi:AraC-like DNA-binding protein